MSAAASQASNKQEQQAGTESIDQQFKPAALEEDDEFEDFPVEDWPQEEAEVPGGTNSDHLWEESWDDDDTNEDFSKQLKEEMKKVEAEAVAAAKR
ncbi:hypothetical protein VTO42DRAFT_852 [Malbranchea cinnamomea]